ncbi:endothelin-converting enzyme 1-like [Dermacentor albipictus]|uniref:endothelin-converting enzyme 1-like n=1 Tax=Dermacentor albipictus TaxID=60249 RepID=UPI0031FCCC4C
MESFKPEDRMDYPQVLEELTMMSGGLSLAYKGYLIFMAKYEEEFVSSNIPDMKLTLNQYFFLQFAMNFCTTKSKEYKSMLNLTGLDSKLRIVVPMQSSFRMSKDFVCADTSVLGTPDKCSIL